MKKIILFYKTPPHGFEKGQAVFDAFRDIDCPIYWSGDPGDLYWSGNSVEMVPLTAPLIPWKYPFHPLAFRKRADHSVISLEEAAQLSCCDIHKLERWADCMVSRHWESVDEQDAWEAEHPEDDSWKK